ncbi:HIT domain-containing protein [Candidatus Bathyarchaeota archaeon]|nr:HIT domain-containing protein [Candidatus Bathyarchaeota archaeon]
MVNLKPLLPGHLLVCPLTRQRRMTDLSAPELTDLMLTVQKVQRQVCRRRELHSFQALGTFGSGVSRRSCQREPCK